MSCPDPHQTLAQYKSFTCLLIYFLISANGKVTVCKITQVALKVALRLYCHAPTKTASRQLVAYTLSNTERYSSERAVPAADTAVNNNLISAGGP